MHKQTAKMANMQRVITNAERSEAKKFINLK